MDPAICACPPKIGGFLDTLLQPSTDKAQAVISAGVADAVKQEAIDADARFRRTLLWSFGVLVLSASAIAAGYYFGKR